MRDYQRNYLLIAVVIAPVLDEFFRTVMVNTDDAVIKTQRIRSLLLTKKEIELLVGADLTKISLQPSL